MPRSNATSNRVWKAQSAESTPRGWEPVGQWQRICCPIDFSDESRRSLMVAAGLAQSMGAELVILHVSSSPGSNAVLPASWEDLTSVKAEDRRLLDEWAKQIAVPGLGVRIAATFGNAAEGIVRFARSEGCDLIVMGTHGRTGLKHLVLGSVAERVLRTAHCPVLATR
jgi:nucleotide-binding universal stress UspA family protein